MILKRPRHAFVPTEDGDDVPLLWFRYVASNYRVTRALLQSKRLLPPGQPLRDDPEVFSRAPALPVDPASPLAPLVTPIRNTAQGSPDLTAIAIFLGVDPDDPCLHWFSLPEFAITTDTLLGFENDLLPYVGKALLRGGKLVAHQRMEKVFGRAHYLETRDWVNLPAAYAREFASTSEEDDRTVMIARLESVRRRCEDALDLRGEMAALRAMAQVNGLLIKEEGKTEKEMEAALRYAPERSLALANPRNKPSLLGLAPSEEGESQTG